MAKERMINTRFWIDDYISNLDPIEKFLFLYFLTNPSTDICGVYEIPLKTVATDTGIEIEMVKKILKRFGRDKKIFYHDGWIGIKNFSKHQKDNPSVKKGIENGLERAPKEILDRLSQTVPSLSHLNLNSNLNSNSNLNTNDRPVFGEFGKVKISQEEYSKLVERFGEPNTKILITELDGYIKSIGKDKYKDHYATLQNWGRRKITEHAQKKSLQTKTRIIANL